MTRAPVNPSLIAWARKRARWEPADLADRFPKLAAWEAGEILPTLKQAEAFARAMHVPIGYLFLPEPPEELLPIADFRTMAGQPVRPSPNLLDMLYAVQERQDWYREFALVTDEPKANFVGSLTTDTPVPAAAAAMAKKLGFDLNARRADCRTWEEALRLFIDRADQAGVLVMVSGVVLSNTHRRLDPKEFRGFALADDHAPLVFINGADTKAGQIFTLAHELAHLWLGASALSNAGAKPIKRHRPEEVWCNAVAAELLAPLDEVQKEIEPGEVLGTTLKRLTERFRVSRLVILRRLLDAGELDRAGFDAAWESELERLAQFVPNKAGGGNFSRTTLARVSHRFARALVESTLEGQTLYRDAFRMLGVKKTETFNNIGREVGIIIDREVGVIRKREL